MSRENNCCGCYNQPQLKCNQCKPCNPCPNPCKFSTCPPPCNLYPSLCNDSCGQNIEPCRRPKPRPRDCNDCTRHQPCERHDRCEEKKRCPVDKYAPCLRTKCGCLSISLTKSASPAFYTAAGQVITYSYQVTNNGTQPLCFPLQIVDSKLGAQLIPRFLLPCAGVITFTRTYTTTTDDLNCTTINNCAVAFIHYNCQRWIYSPAANATVTNGSADLSGNMSQAVGVTGTVTATVNIFNAVNSLTTANYVTLLMPIPPYATSIVPGSGVIQVTGGVLMSAAAIAIGESQTFTFSYNNTGPTGTSYTWTGTIKAVTYDPVPGNNTVSNTIVV